jgi:hypothetical protein
VVSHLSKTGDSWGNFLFRNNFTLPENEIESPLHLNENPSPCQSNPTIENLCVNLQEDHATTDQTSVAIRKPSGKKPRCDFMPRKSLEEVLDVLKDKIPTVPIHEPTQVVLNKSIVKKNGRHKKQSNPDVNFTNKRPGRLLSRKLRNQQRGNEKSTPVIEIDDHFDEDDIDNFIAQEDVDDQFPGKQNRY